jgi:malate dehydrogenase (oxaloacetate-decarboxylating)(NADP+)
MGLDNKLVKSVMQKARKDPKRVVFAEADNYKILRAAQIVKDEGIAHPILLGKKKRIEELIEHYQLDLGDIEIIDPRSRKEIARREEFGKFFYEKRRRKGVTLPESIKLMRERNYFGSAMVKLGHGDALISGLTRNYPDTLRPALQIIGQDKSINRITGMYVLITKQGPLFLADTTINFNPTAEELVDITLLTARAVEQLKIKPRIGLLSYSNFGSSKGEDAQKMAKAVEILHRDHPKLIVDGELQANFALNKSLLQEIFPFTMLAKTGVNTLIFPNLAAGNIAYKLIQEMGASESIRPVLLGMNKPVHVLQLGSTVREIVNMIAIAVVDAQTQE